MRKFKFILGIIIVVIIAFTSLSQLNSQNNPNMKKGFYLGPMSHYFLNVLQTDSHNRWYQELSYNLMQSYCAHLDTIDSNYQTGGQKDGGFFEDTSNYLSAMKYVIAKWNNISHDNSLIFEREKILRPAFGQRFTYQADDIGDWHNKLFPAFGYDSSETGHDTTETWMGEMVTSRRCVVGRDTAGFIVKGLYENCSQTNDTTIVPDGTNSSGHDRLYSDIKQPEYNMRWFIKPRMRIDSVYAKTHRTDTVVTVYVKNFKGNIIDSTSIICNNFLTKVGDIYYYNGIYMERFLNTEIQTNDTANFLSVRADLLAAGKGGKPDSVSKVDYQVKWHGKVDVWLDHVRVDDSWAHYLFTDTWENEPNNQANIWKFHRRIKEEVDAFANKPGLGYFWVDEVQYPNLECIGEVNKLVKQYSNNTMSLLFITDPRAFMGWPAFRAINLSTIVDEANWDICIEKAIKDSALTDIMITQWFPFYYFVRYPDVFSNIPSYYYISQHVFPAQNYCAYTSDNDISVQNTVSWFLRQHKYFYKKAREKGLIYGVINQINSDENNIKRNGNDWGLREPTNEEISLLMHTSMAYGAKVMLEFSYTSRLQDTLVKTFNWGLTTSDNNFTGKRETNYYGQHKWGFVAGLNDKIKRTGDYMYPKNLPNEHLIHDKTLTVNTVTYPDCNECGYANYDYVNDIKSLAPYLNGATVPCNQSEGGGYDNLSKRFWELGFFKTNPLSSKPPDNSKYLYAVNKRTYPVNDTNDYGDIRVLKIKFNSSQLTGFNNWVIKEAITDSVISYFNKSSTDFISSGEFQPGEGKLLKIAPVMQEGGTLVCDETVSTSTFTCNGTVFNNGYDLTISPNTVITFSNYAGIEVNGGSFECGEYSTNDNLVIFNGIDSCKGLVLKNCSSIGIYNTNINDLKNDSSETAVLI